MTQCNTINHFSLSKVVYTTHIHLEFFPYKVPPPNFLVLETPLRAMKREGAVNPCHLS